MSILAPINAGESDLSATRTELLWVLANTMGWDHDPNEWSTEETTNGGYVLTRAVRKFYSAHPWTFLLPTRDFQLITGESVYDLPDDFAELKRPIFYTKEFSALPPIVQSSLGAIADLGASEASRGTPRYYVIEPLPVTGEQIGQRYSIRFDVAPLTDYTVRTQYRVTPYNLTTSRPYPLGGVATADALSAAVAAQAEFDLKDGGDGSRQAEFLRLLSLAIAEDIRKSPAILGTNLNNGGRRVGALQSFDPVIRYNGNIVSG